MRGWLTAFMSAILVVTGIVHGAHAHSPLLRGYCSLIDDRRFVR